MLLGLLVPVVTGAGTPVKYGPVEVGAGTPVINELAASIKLVEVDAECGVEATSSSITPSQFFMGRGELPAIMSLRERRVG